MCLQRVRAKPDRRYARMQSASHARVQSSSHAHAQSADHFREQGASHARMQSSHHPTHIRNTPNRDSSTGAFNAAEIANPNTVRVSAGSITPSSHSRADA